MNHKFHIMFLLDPVSVQIAGVVSEDAHKRLNCHFGAKNVRLLTGSSRN